MYTDQAARATLLNTVTGQLLTLYLRQRVCFHLCLPVNKITQKLVTKSLWNFMECLDIIQGTID